MKENRTIAMRQSQRRRFIQRWLWAVVLITIFGGLYSPWLGFIVPVVMLMGVVGGVMRGRFVCGWLCPRGAFFDVAMARMSPKRRIPSFFRRWWWRVAMLMGLMGFMIYQISLNPSDPLHWGRVFVRICIITTAAGILLAFIVHPRTWCSFCPMGTIQAAAGGKKRPLKMDAGCVECRSCERACPLDLPILREMEDGTFKGRDCLQCPECQAVCPKGILHF